MRRRPVVIVIDDEREIRALAADPETLDRLVAEERFEAQGMALATYGGHWLYRWLTPWRSVAGPDDPALYALTPEERAEALRVWSEYPGATLVTALAATVVRGQG